ncbi:MAG: hypothetical protein ACQCN3_15105 [Candidatus Bathyarchaeia archaeon]|jgi:hypothetical protein
MEMKKTLKKLRGWFPQEPLQNRYSKVNAKPISKAEFDKKLFRTSMIANLIMLNVFLGTNFLLISPRYNSIEVSILQWSIFLSALIGVNVLIYLYYKRRLLSKGAF